MYVFDLSAGDPGAYQLALHVRRGLQRGDAPSTAPIVKRGRWYSGDTGRHVPDAYDSLREFYRVQLRSGRKVTVNLREPAGGNVAVRVLPVGTNDDNFLSVESVGSASPDSTGHGSLQLTVPRTGRYVLEFRSDAGGGQFSFRVQRG